MERKTFSDAFEAHAKFKAERPQMKSSTVFYAEKMGEEQWELYQASTNLPINGDQRHMEDESADVFLTLIGFWQSIGLSPETALRVVFRKLDELEIRYRPQDFNNTNGRSYEENYSQAKGARDSALRGA